MDSTISNNKAIKLKAIDQLVKGKELATKLQQIISQHGLSGLGQVEDLATRILESFDSVISVLDSFESVSSTSLAAVEGSQNASCDIDGKFEDSGDSRKRSAPTKGKRGCYKRKKKSETTIVKKHIIEDEFSWRKYGQKEILNSKFPRNYYRCTHKYTQGCMATKQVQKIELEPKMFNITYIGKHTCNNNNNEEAPKIKPFDHHDEIIIDSEELKSPSLTTSMKKEEENHHHHGSSNANDLSLVWQEVAFEDDHHHEAMYGCGETSASDFNVLGSTNLMVFGVSSNFGLSDNNEQFSYFDAYTNLL